MQTIDEVRECPRPILTAADVAPLLGSDAHTIRLMARRCPEQLGFPVVLIGSRVKIPRLAFLAFMTGTAANPGA